MGRKVGKVGDTLEQQVKTAKSKDEVDAIVLEAEQDLLQIAEVNNVTLQGRKVG